MYIFWTLAMPGWSGCVGWGQQTCVYMYVRMYVWMNEQTCSTAARKRCLRRQCGVVKT